MLTVRDLLSRKKNHTASIHPNQTVHQALNMLASYDIGALLVIEGREILGIFSERDYARKLSLKGKNENNTLVGEVMARELTVVTPEDTVEYCMKLMTDQHIRHLPVMQADRLAGIVSIGDVVKGIIDQQKATIDNLESYISGGYLHQETIQ